MPNHTPDELEDELSPRPSFITKRSHWERKLLLIRQLAVHKIRSVSPPPVMANNIYLVVDGVGDKDYRTGNNKVKTRNKQELRFPVPDSSKPK
jgi:hypothetical protein